MRKPPLLTGVALQTGFCFLLSAVCWALGSSNIAFSVLLGGATIVLTNAWYLWRLLSIRLGEDSSEFLRSYYRVEVSKLCFAAVLIAIILYTDHRYSASANHLEAYLDHQALFVSFLVTSVVVTLWNSMMLVRWINNDLTN